MTATRTALRHRRIPRWAIIIGAAWVVGVALAIIIMVALGSQVAHLSGQVDAANRDRTSLAGDVNKLRDQVIAGGEVPVAPPASPEPTAPATASLDEDAVRAVAREVIQSEDIAPRSQVQALVEAAVARVESQPGLAPTEDQVIGATRPIVQAFLAANPPPAGATGEAGSNGTDGQPGTNGANGVDGRNGTNGVGIQSATFDTTTCSIVQTLTDGSSQTFGPLCGPSPFPLVFTFTVPASGVLDGDDTYTCTVTAAADPATCARREP